MVKVVLSFFGEGCQCTDSLKLQVGSLPKKKGAVSPSDRCDLPPTALSAFPQPFCVSLCRRFSKALLVGWTEWVFLCLIGHMCHSKCCVEGKEILRNGTGSGIGVKAGADKGKDSCRVTSVFGTHPSHQIQMGSGTRGMPHHKNLSLFLKYLSTLPPHHPRSDLTFDPWHLCVSCLIDSCTGPRRVVGFSQLARLNVSTHSHKRDLIYQQWAFSLCQSLIQLQCHWLSLSRHAAWGNPIECARIVCIYDSR